MKPSHRVLSLLLLAFVSGCPNCSTGMPDGGFVDSGMMSSDSGGDGVDASVFDAGPTTKPFWCHDFPHPTRLLDGGVDLDSGIFTQFAGPLFTTDGSVIMSGQAAPLIGCFETTEVQFDPMDAGLIRGQNPKLFGGCASGSALGTCPAPGAPARDLWYLDASVPFNPYDSPTSTTNEPPAGGACLTGMGYSFERGVFAPWVLTPGFNFAPVYGNNVSIDRIRPPGYIPTGAQTPLNVVGGDYWEFSRDIGYAGNYWVGSMDGRADWKTTPGRMEPATAGMTLTSPVFTVGSQYLSFFIGGSRSSDQRVELVILANANNRAQLLAQYRGIGVEEMVPGGTVNREPEPNKIVVRASTASADAEYMRRRVFWNVQAFQNLPAQLRVIDVSGTPGHINTDDFKCEKSAPPLTTWLTAPDAGQPAVGQILREEPLWGATDTHAHVASNLGFGGHYIWGDASDDLSNVYNCHNPLPEIKNRAGVTVRPAIERPNLYTGCFVSASIIGLINAVGVGVCSLTAGALGAVPFVGPFLAATVIGACTVALTAATTALLHIPAATTITQHGAAMPTSAGIRVGPMIEWILNLAGEGESASIHGMLELQDFDSPDGAHSGFGLGGSHQRYHHTMIERAYAGGLRLMVIDALHSRVMQYVFDGRDNVDDWQGITANIEGIKRLVAPDTDATYFPGPLRNIAEIVYTPAQAKNAIRRNKLAIILGTETQELGKARFAGDTMEAQVRDLYAMGIRKITAIHGINNPIGGTGIFNDIYNSAGVFANLTKNERGEPSGAWGPEPETNIRLPNSLPVPLGGMSLGTAPFIDNLQPFACPAGGCPWNMRNGGWFSIMNPMASPADFIGDQASITFRAGIEGAHNGTNFNPFEDPEFQFASKLKSIQWLLGTGPGGIVASSRCSLDQMFFPLVGGLNRTAKTNYDSSPAHMNDTGLSVDGATFIENMMKRGMIVDTDHFGQKTRADTQRISSNFFNAADAGISEVNEYPSLAIHSDVRRYSRHGPYPVGLAGSPDYASTLGFGVETDKSVAEIQHLSQNKSVISPGVNGAVMTDPDGLIGTQINNDCDFSSKSYAVKYLQMVKLMRGHGVASSTDMNSPSPQLRSRFGNDTACFSYDKPGRREQRAPNAAGEWKVASWPRDWTPDRVDECRYNSLRTATEKALHPRCHSSNAAVFQLLELNGVEYSDYAGRPAASLSLPVGAPTSARNVVASGATEIRDDGSLAMFGIPQMVAYGGGGALRQMRPMRKFRNNYVTTNNRGWDVNIDGMTNEGLLPDVWQDMRNVGVSWEQMGPMFNAANDFLEMWETSCRIGEAWHRARGLAPLARCD
jgi:microsomal dipeptidase-like Zn-dependent dipeptidase